MALESINPYYLDMDHYWSALNAAWQHSNRNEIIAKWMEDKFESNVSRVLSERLGDNFCDQPLRVLGVGSGEGYQEIIQMKILKSNFSQISATVIEPSTEQIIKYQNTVAKSSDLGGVDYEWHNQTFQEYMESTGTAKHKYHFITIVHAIYGVGEVEESIKILHEFLEPGGMIFMIVVTGNEGFGKLWTHVPDLKRTSGTSEPATTSYTNSADVKSVLAKYRIAYTQYSYTESLNTTVCFTDSDTVVARLLLDNITIIKNFKESVPDDVFNQVLDFLKRNARVVKGDQGGDKFYLDTKSDILVISK